LLVGALLATFVVPPGAAAAPAPPAATIVPTAVQNVRQHHLIPDTQGAISMNFQRYGHRDVLFLSGMFGL